ncbi:MAG: hypothetical protein AB7K24_06100, partial [Gemmataceae bacterium]
PAHVEVSDEDFVVDDEVDSLDEVPALASPSRAAEPRNVEVTPSAPADSPPVVDEPDIFETPPAPAASHPVDDEPDIFEKPALASHDGLASTDKSHEEPATHEVAANGGDEEPDIFTRPLSEVVSQNSDDHGPEREQET